MSVLCRKCEVISFDDSKHNGSVRTSAQGETYFVPNSDDGDLRQLLLLDYDLKDTLPDLPNLSQSASDGCELCSVIKDKITAFVKLDQPVYVGDDGSAGKPTKRTGTALFIHKLCYSMYEDVHEDKPYRSWLQGLYVYFKLLAVNQDEEESSHALRLEAQADPHSRPAPPPNPKLRVPAEQACQDPCARWLSIPRRPLARDILSEAGVQRLTELIELAFSIPSVNPVVETPRLPTRLIDVGLRDSEDDNEEPRLVMTADYPPLQKEPGAQKYIALSYCWGSPDQAKHQLKTSQSTLSDWLHQIPFSLLPRTHQDAITLCRVLGVRYVWIDSLCIVQDDKADWEREAQQMGSCYANAYLTVCAAQGNSCLDGFLGRTVPSRVINVPFTSSINPSVSGSYSLFAAPRQFAPLQIETDIFGDGRALMDFMREDPPRNPYRFTMHSYDPYGQVDYCHWKKRGWIFQEMMLSPRMLLFTEAMVHLCVGDKLLQSEDGPRREGRFQVPSHMLQRDRESPELESDALDQWRVLVSAYSSRSLTYDEDRLPALSALTRIWAAKIEGKYLAGLFSSDLHHGLLWAHFGMRTTTQFLNPGPESHYIAPSWS